TSSVAASPRRAGCSSSSALLGARRLEPKLRALARDRRRVVPREARAAERGFRPPRGGLQAFEREIGEGSRPDVLADFLDRPLRGNRLVFVGVVDSVVALGGDWWGVDP